MLILRTDWREDEHARPSHECFVNREDLSVASARRMIEHMLGHILVVCRTDEEQGILHATLDMLDLRYEEVGVPDPPLPADRILESWEDMVIVIDQPEVPWGVAPRRTFQMYQLLSYDDIPF